MWHRTNMAHFARVKNNKVTSVIVIEQATLDEHGGWVCPNMGEFSPKEDWIQTSYNTREGEHKMGGTPMRKNYAGRGYTYDAEKDAFIEPKPYDSWVLNEDKCIYEAPVSIPKDGKPYEWNEETSEWIEVDFNSQIKPK